MSDPSTRIRTARPADARAICEIWNPVIAGTCHTFTSELKTAPALAGVLEARAACWLVFCRGEQVHGFASFAQFRPGPGYAAPWDTPNAERLPAPATSLADGLIWS